MKIDNFTIKSQEAIQRAFEIAQGNEHQAVETGHLLKGILSEADSVSTYILKKVGIIFLFSVRCWKRLLIHIQR